MHMGMGVYYVYLGMHMGMCVYYVYLGMHMGMGVLHSDTSCAIHDVVCPYTV